MHAAMCRYQDYQAKDIPVVEEDGVRVRVMAGEYKGSKGPIIMRNPGLLMDVTVSKGGTFTKEVGACDHLMCNGCGAHECRSVLRPHC